MIIYYLPTHGDAAARLDRLTRTEDPPPATSCRSGTCSIKTIMCKVIICTTKTVYYSKHS